MGSENVSEKNRSLCKEILAPPPDESVELFRKLVDQSNDAIFVVDPETSRILAANEKACTSLGYSRAELLGLCVPDVEEVIKDISEWRDQVRELREKGSVVIEGVHRRKDGTTFPAEISVRYVADGGRNYMVAVARDISWRREMEQQMARDRQDWEDAFDTINDMITVHDADFNIIRANRAAEKILHLPVLRMEKAKCYQYYHGSGCPPEGCPSCNVLRTGRAEAFELYEPHLKMFIEIRAIPRLNEKGEVMGLIHVVRDITERKAQEEELARYRAHLEEIVAERTRDLERANMELERSNRELEQFAYAASHDLKEPLLAVTADMKLLDRKLRDSLDPDGAGLLKDAFDGASRMQKMITDLLAYARAGAGGQAFEAVDLGAALDTAIANLKTAVEENGAQVTRGDLPAVMADRTQMVLLLQNLVSNAIKFRSNEPPRIHVEAERKDGQWLLRVRDNGMGIPPEHRERIFEIFQRVETGKGHKGTGIGLATCRKIVERHGGKIWVEDAPGEGSTFSFTLPAER
jgi:PAS domain S-box-containing protein